MASMRSKVQDEMANMEVRLGTATASVGSMAERMDAVERVASSVREQLAARDSDVVGSGGAVATEVMSSLGARMKAMEAMCESMGVEKASVSRVEEQVAGAVREAVREASSAMATMEERHRVSLEAVSSRVAAPRASRRVDGAFSESRRSRA